MPPAMAVPAGGMAEWLRTGLQIRLPRFDSGCRLQQPRRAPARFHRAHDLCRTRGIIQSRPGLG